MTHIPRIIFFTALAVMVSSQAIMAQDPYSVQTRPSRGFMPNADQLSSPVDSIDPVSGKLHIEIPLASLPRGRADSGFDLNLVYDSHLYDVDPEIVPPDFAYPNWPTQIGYNLVGIGPQTTGGWHYNVDNLKLLTEVYVGTTGETPCPEGAPRLNFRLSVALLDGSQHIMIPIDNISSSGQLHEQGWSGVEPLSGHALPCAHEIGYPVNYTGWLTYYSIDGSYLKLDTYVDGTGSHPYYLYFPDGRVLVGEGLGFNALYDANGNAIHFSNHCYDELCIQAYTSISDDAGHEIRLNRNPDNIPYGGDHSNASQTVTAVGPEGTMTTTINWETIQLGADNSRTYPFSFAPWYLTKPFNKSLPVVKYIQLPMKPAVPVPSSQTPDTWNSYAFGYAGDPTGWGELISMRTPSGMLVQYGPSGTVPDATGSTPGSLIGQRSITHDGTTDLVWTYSYGQKTTITNPDGSQTSYWHGPPANYLDSSIPYNYVGDVVYRIDEPNGRVQKRMWSQNRIPIMGGISYSIQNPWVRRETTTIGNAAGTPSLTSVTDRMIDKNGNLLQSTSYDWVNYNPSGPETGSTVMRINHFTYYAGVPDAFTITNSAYGYWSPHFYPLTTGSSRRLDAVKRKEVFGNLGVVAAVTELIYDDPFRAGNVTSELHWDSEKSASAPGPGALSASNSQVLTRGYDGFGNVKDIFEPQIRTHITYDPTGSVPTRVDYAHGSPQQRSWGYDWNFLAGTLNSKTDLDNNIATTYGFTHDETTGRITITTDEAGLRKTETIYDNANLQITVKNDLISHGDGNLQVTTQYDQLGRSVLTRSSEPGNADGIKLKSNYYPLLNRTVHSSPYRTTSDATLEWTCTQSDSSMRVIAVATFKGAEPNDCASPTNRTGVTSTIYDSNQTTITDPASNRNTQIVDGLGRLMNAVEDPFGLYYITSYTYDTLGNLTRVDQGAQTRTFTYSSLGRLLLAHNPENGNLNYTYSDSGDLLTRSDDRGFVTTNTYDAMHRVQTKSYSGDGGVTPNVTYSYFEVGDSAPNIGQLKSMTSSAATVNYGSYDVLGRMGSNTQTTNGSAYTFQYTYRLSDSLSSMQYPSGKTVNYAVDNAGRVNQITAGSKTYADLPASEAPFTADGRIAHMKLGNDLWESRIFQAPGSPTLLKLGTSANASDKLELEYNYSPTANNGNLVSHFIRQPGGHTWEQNYTYDSLNRLAQAVETNGFNRTYGYDRYGNRWVASSSGITAYEPHEPTAGSLFNTSNNRLANHSYDAAGNQISYDPRTLTYDAENRMISATSPQNGNEYFVYDGDGRRVSKTWTPNGGSSQTTRYVYDPSSHVAAEYTSQTSTTTGTSWMFTDMLGSVRAVTGEKPQSGSASTTECYDYLPFGRMLSSSDNGRNTGCYPANPDFALSSVESPKFTGQIRDSETGLDFFGARYLSAAQGRFTSSDPLLNSGRPNEPQTWNRYSYVSNNPLRYRDPLGLFKWATDCDEAINSECKAERDRFRNDLSTLKNSTTDFEKGSKERKQIEKVIKRIGEEGKGSTRVAFGDAGETANGPNYGLTIGNKMTVNYDAIDSTKKEYQLNPAESAAFDAGVVGHEGAHLGTGGFLTEFLTMHGEHTAYYTESLIYQGLHNTDRPFGLWNESWSVVDQQLLDQKRERAIHDTLHPAKKPNQK